MNVTIYTEDFEPINVIDLPREILDEIERKGIVRIGINNPDTPSNYIDLFLVKVLWIDNTYKPVIITPDEELVLKVLPQWVPGQLSVIQSYKKQIKTLTENLIKAMRK